MACEAISADVDSDEVLRARDPEIGRSELQNATCQTLIKMSGCLL